MLRQLYLLLLSALLCTAVQAQTTISGTVTADDDTVIPAVLTVLDKDSNLLGTTLTDTTGKYALSIVTGSPALITAKATGFAAQSKPLDAPQVTSTIDFALSPENNKLEGITVTAQKPLLERRADRIIFNVSASISAIGGNALEAVRKSPGVIVNSRDNSIALAGKSSVQVMINGRLQQLSGEDLIAYLQSVPSDNIDRIEVITTPPAQYDAAGNTGLINIVLKKKNTAGLNGNVRGAYEQSTYATGIGGGAINYRNGLVNIYGSANYTSGNKQNVERVYTYYPEQAYRLDDPYRKHTQTLQYTIGTDINAGLNHLIGVEFSATEFDRHDRITSDLYIDDIAIGQNDSTIATRGHSDAARYTRIANLNYIWTIDTAGKKLTVNANQLWYNADRDRTYKTIAYDNMGVPAGNDAQQKNDGNQQVRIKTAQVDMEWPTAFAQLSAGAKLSFIDNHSRNDFFNMLGGIYINDPDVSNAFRYKENIRAAYINALKQQGKWNMQAGLRAEATQTTGTSPTLQQTKSMRYINLFPTAYATYTPSEAHSFSLNYSRRVNRPGYASLNPFRLYTSRYFYTEGNPYLRPSFAHTIEAGYTLQHKYTLSAYYQHEENRAGLVFYTDDISKEMYGTNKNFGDVDSWGLTASASWSPSSHWEMQAVLNASVQRLQSSIAGGNGRRFGPPAFYLSANNSFVLNRQKTLLAEANVYCLSRYQDDFFYMEPIGSLDTSVKALFIDKQLAVSLGITDLFRTQRSRGTNQLTGQTINSYFDQQNFRLSAQYTFGNKQVKNRRERNTGIEEERRRM